MPSSDLQSTNISAPVDLPHKPGTSAGAIETMLTRRSAGALVEPAPAAEVLDLALRCALAAPDHDRLRTARFIIVEGKAREHLGRICAEGLRRRQPDSTEVTYERELKKPLRAPLIIVAACSPQQGKIPEIEQILSVGASVENLLLALHAQGFGAMWRTGDATYDHEVKRALGLREADHIVGFIYVGTSAVQPRQTERSQPPDAIRRLAA